MFWSRLDPTFQAKINFARWKDFVKQQPDTKQCEKAARLLFSNRTSFTLGDFLQVIWPCAGPKQIEAMLQWVPLVSERIPTPPLIDDEIRERLIKEFNLLDTDGSGMITIYEFIEGSISKETARQIVESTDQDSDGMISTLEFLEMMCPPGCRPHARSTKVLEVDGSQLYQ